jgi:hypothetical protein
MVGVHNMAPPSELLSIQNLNTKGGQHPIGKNKKGKIKKKDNNATIYQNNKVGREKKEKKNVKFPCKLYMELHMTHHCPKMEESR